MYVSITILAVLVISSGYFINESFAEILPNQAFLLEGSGFGVTENVIKISEIDLGISSQIQKGSTINFVTEDGFITLDNDEFIISELEGKFLREGRYIRLNGNVESVNGLDTTISFFGRLVEESKDGIVYGITGRITVDDENYKIIYTVKLSELTKIKITPTELKTGKQIIIHILKDSTKQGVNSITGSTDTSKFRHFSQDRISISPKTTITFVNNDNVSHSLLSGKLTGDRYKQYIADGRISTGVILPNKSIDITFNDVGFYRLYDPDYQWMDITAYVFPNAQNNVILK